MTLYEEFEVTVQPMLPRGHMLVISKNLFETCVQ